MFGQGNQRLDPVSRTLVDLPVHGCLHRQQTMRLLVNDLPTSIGLIYDHKKQTGKPNG